jgi:hypothetical protein
MVVFDAPHKKRVAVRQGERGKAEIRVLFVNKKKTSRFPSPLPISDLFAARILS